MMIQFDSNAIGTAAPIRDWIAAMEQAFLDTADGKVILSPRTQVEHGHNSLIVMPCMAEDFFSTKQVSVFPKNLLKKKPVIYGTVILNDGQTGEPLACLDGGKLTAMRTAAVGSIGIKYLAPEQATTLGIIGLGIQGFHQALFACETRPIRELRIMDHSSKVMDLFSKRFRAYYKDVKVIPCATSLELCMSSEILITATGSHRPVVPGKGRWWEDKTIIGIGSYKPEMREIPEAPFRDMKEIYIDSQQGIDEAGDLLRPLNKGIISRDQVINMAELIRGRKASMDCTRFFKSVGMAAFDLYGAKLVYQQLR